MVNDRGQLVGMNTLSNTLQNGRIIQGQYYAITTKHIKALLPDLEAGKSTNDVGWDLILNGPDIATVLQSYGASEPSTDGLFVLGVDTGSPAASANLDFGDAILQIEGSTVTTFQDICDILSSHGPGQTLSVHISSAYASQGPGFYTQKLTLR